MLENNKMFTLGAFSTEPSALYEVILQIFSFLLILNFSFVSPNNLLPLKLQYGLKCSARMCWWVDFLEQVAKLQQAVQRVMTDQTLRALGLGEVLRGKLVSFN